MAFHLGIKYLKNFNIYNIFILLIFGKKFFCFQDIDTAKDYFQRKIKFVTEQMEKIQFLGLEKSKIRDAIVEIAEMKLAQQQS